MTNICANIALPSGEIKPCEIEIFPGQPFRLDARSKHFGIISFSGESLFGALVEFRLWLENSECLLLCNAARKDAYPSRMALQMGGGRKIYLLRPGVQARREDLVDIFEAASPSQVCTVAEQRANYEAWIGSLG